MSRRRKPVEKPAPEARRARLVAHAAGQTLQSYGVGALPLINRILERLQLEDCLQQMLPQEDQRVVVPAATGLTMLQLIAVTGAALRRGRLGCPASPRSVGTHDQTNPRLQ